MERHPEGCLFYLSGYNSAMTHDAPLVIGIAGGSGSGKTTVAQEILQRVGPDRIAYIQHDSYYKDLTGLPPTQRAEVLISHIEQLKNWHSIDVPVYDFSTDSRTEETFKVNPRGVVIVEGILIFVDPVLRSLFDVKLFVDTDADVRLIRRLQRDISERGRTVESVIKQYTSTVRPMHLEFVEPSKRYADVIIPEGGFNRAAMDMVVARIESLLS